MAIRTLRVYLDGTPAGTLTQSTQGSLGFVYDERYVDQADPTPLSLSLPVLSGRHRDKAVRAYLEGLLPDSEGARQRWGREYNVSPNNPFALLTHVGRDAAGAVQILLPDDDSADAGTRTGDVEWLSQGDLEDLVGRLASHQSDWDPGKFGGRWSLAGAQPKIALSGSGIWSIRRPARLHTHNRHRQACNCRIRTAPCQRDAVPARCASTRIACRHL